MDPNEAIGMGNFVITYLSGLVALGLVAEALRATIYCSIAYFFVRKLLRK